MSHYESPPAARIGSIETRWSMVRRAHGDDSAAVVDARRELVLRYSPAIRWYVGAMTRDEDEADEIAQDAVVRLLQGDFGGADPDQGRFRDLLKTAVRNMVRNHWRRKATRNVVDYDVRGVAGESGAGEPDPWDQSWRRTVLEAALSRLEAYEQQHPESIACTLLRLRMERPEAASDQLAEQLHALTGKELGAATVRQKLRRARLRFAEHLVRELADGLDDPSPERVEDELVALGLIDQVGDLLPPDWRERLL